MKKKEQVNINLKKFPKAIEIMQKIADGNYDSEIAPVARKYLLIGLEKSGFNVTGETNKSVKSESKKV